jgi:hypothetical protein
VLDTVLGEDVKRSRTFGRYGVIWKTVP